MADEHNQWVMSRFEKEGQSFLIRIWKENRDTPLQIGAWRGWVQHVQSQQKKHFNSTDDIAGIINWYLHEDLAFDKVFEPIEEDDQQ
jgi:hypothetical protein